MLEEEIFVAPGFVASGVGDLGVALARSRASPRERRSRRDRPARRRLSSVGVRSAPPPNQVLVVRTRRVFICTVGTCGLQGWAITETPAAQKRGSFAAPGIWPANSSGKAPWTVEQCAPIFSNRRPRSIAIRPPPPGAPLGSVRSHGSIAKRPGARAASTPANSRSSASIAATILPCSAPNQSSARLRRGSSSAGSVMPCAPARQGARHARSASRAGCRGRD